MNNTESEKFFRRLTEIINKEIELVKKSKGMNSSLCQDKT